MTLRLPTCSIPSEIAAYAQELKRRGGRAPRAEVADYFGRPFQDLHETALHLKLVEEGDGDVRLSDRGHAFALGDDTDRSRILLEAMMASAPYRAFLMKAAQGDGDVWTPDQAAAFWQGDASLKLSDKERQKAGSTLLGLMQAANLGDFSRGKLKLFRATKALISSAARQSLVPAAPVVVAVAPKARKRKTDGPVVVEAAKLPLPPDAPSVQVTVSLPEARAARKKVAEPRPAEVRLEAAPAVEALKPKRPRKAQAAAAELPPAQPEPVPVEAPRRPKAEPAELPPVAKAEPVPTPRTKAPPLPSPMTVPNVQVTVDMTNWDTPRIEAFFRAVYGR